MASSLLLLALCVSAMTLVHAGKCFKDVEKTDGFSDMLPPPPVVSASSRDNRAPVRSPPNPLGLRYLVFTHEECSNPNHNHKMPCYKTVEGIRLLHYRPESGEPQPLTCYCKLCSSDCGNSATSEQDHCHDPLTLSPTPVKDFCEAAVQRRSAYSQSNSLCWSRSAGCVFRDSALHELLVNRVRSASRANFADDARARVRNTAIYRAQAELLNSFAKSPRGPAIQEAQVHNILASAFAAPATGMSVGLEAVMGGWDAVPILKTLLHLLYRRLLLTPGQTHIESLEQLKSGVPDLQTEDGKKMPGLFFMQHDADIFAPSKRYQDVVFDLYAAMNRDAFADFSIAALGEPEQPKGWLEKVLSRSKDCNPPGLKLFKREGVRINYNDPIDLLLSARGYTREENPDKKADKKPTCVPWRDLLGVGDTESNDQALQNAVTTAAQKLHDASEEYRRYGDSVQGALALILEAEQGAIQFREDFGPQAVKVLKNLKSVVSDQMREWVGDSAAYLPDVGNQLDRMLRATHVFHRSNDVPIDSNLPAQIKQVFTELDTLLKANSASTPRSLGELAREVPLLVLKQRLKEAKQQIIEEERGAFRSQARPVLETLLQGKLALRSYTVNLIVCLRHALAFKALGDSFNEILQKTAHEVTQVRRNTLQGDFRFLFPKTFQDAKDSALHFHYLLSPDETDMLRSAVTEVVNGILVPKASTDFGPGSMSLQDACRFMNEKGLAALVAAGHWEALNRRHG